MRLLGGIILLTALATTHGFAAHTSGAMAKLEINAVDHQRRIALSLGQVNGFKVVAELATDSGGGKDLKTKSDTPSTGIKPGTKIGDVAINSKDGAEMVWVPAGDFLMGSSDEEIAALLKDNPGWKLEWFDKDKPQHKIYLDGYWVYKCEVTVAQYRNFCSETGRKMPEEPQWGRKDDHPIVKVTWQNASDYAEWAGALLPTEAQWEKAARGTDGRTYPWGNEWDAAKCMSRSWGTDPAGSNPAGASPYGCLNLAGNVWEWCADRYLGSYYAQSPAKDPRGPENGSVRVLRGGSWSYTNSADFRASMRAGVVPSAAHRDDFIGFRCVICAQGQ